ncbi:3-deoxy-7-phosphoheptulonate synthase [Treponema sp. HNW]|uniref:3-deoxy-7-phosphoheptulonate synthase n=1 Tax=Treponema sp. HNW TaxID=3116654 RepID=UPI003D0D87FC
MIIVIKPRTNEKDLDDFLAFLKTKGTDVHVSRGENTTIVGLIGDTSRMSEETLRAHDVVAQVVRVQEPYKMANRKFHPDDTVIECGLPDSAGEVSPRAASSRRFGGGGFAVIAGPCSVESEAQLTSIAEEVKKSGAGFLRGGAFKPRTSPYAFQGLGAEGIRLLEAAKKATGLPIVTELMNIRHLDEFRDVDVIQVGARNMQNFDLLKELGGCGKPILLKRGLSATIKELLMSAEYIMASGNERVILCERGIRTFDSYTRNTLDVSAVPYLKKVTHLPVIIDPSHACGINWMVHTLSKAAFAVGADGVMIEVHNNPSCALCDGEQAVTPFEFDEIMQSLKKYAQAEGRCL